MTHVGTPPDGGKSGSRHEARPLPPLPYIPAGERDAYAAVDAEIAARLKAVGETKNKRQSRLRSGPAASPVEPHRDFHVYALGADLAHCGLTARDAYALMGLRSLGAARACQLILDADQEAPGTYLARLLAIVVDRHRDMLEPRGRQVSWLRRWHAYEAELASWRAQPAELRERGAWRELAMTSRQRELIRETATLLDLDLPGDLNRGAAADWLESHGANLSYRKEY